MATYEPVIGLEVHAELLTHSKMFCPCPVVETTDGEPNSAVCMVCAGMPGALPVTNRRAVEYTMMVGLALHCQVAEFTIWERKSYFYPDLVKNYQISQYQYPLCFGGWLDVDVPAPFGPLRGCGQDASTRRRRIRIRRAHLEEDTGKLFHLTTAGGKSVSLMDYNRSGVPLLEIVTEPDMHSVEEVKALAAKLRSIVRYLGVNSGDMEKGVIRFEANISVREAGSSVLNPRTEVKNLNSFRAMVRAIEYEIARQSALYERGERVAQQTLGWDETRGVTYAQRSKEQADDYRYFPEPDLPPLEIAREWVEQVRARLPELPDAKLERFVGAYGLTLYDANLLTAERETADWYEQAVAAAAGRATPKGVANWTIGEIFRLMKERNLEIGRLAVTPAALAELVALVENRTINAATGKEVLDEMAASGRTSSAIIAEAKLEQISDRDALDAIVAQVLRDNPGPVGEYLGGKETILRWLIGQAMKASKGKANPNVVQDALLAQLARLRG
jgi:aspartyl-tRNA(Asn)/glutamyl-tRNA(Gln) amidotransferase subunit B